MERRKRAGKVGRQEQMRPMLNSTVPRTRTGTAFQTSSVSRSRVRRYGREMMEQRQALMQERKLLAWVSVVASFNCGSCVNGWLSTSPVLFEAMTGA